eukprot:m.194469 g.194469  ORF g.194469 m.194469 type:complete len:435 (-) comp32530_c0_seq1:247-1551(-)
MSGATYGGDEVNALVFDFGTHTTKAGFAGEDAPKAVFSTMLGCVPNDDGVQAMDTDSSQAATSHKKYVSGSTKLAFPRSGMELKSPVNDGLIEDWDLFEALVEHTYDHLNTDSKDHPLMRSECPWNTKELREKEAELMFEKFDVPALFLCKSAVLTTFACGRSTALVVDGGANSMSVTPVYDGFVLYNNIKRNNIAGNFLTDYYRNYLEKDKNLDIVPVYKIKSKSAVGEGETAKFIAKKLQGITNSYDSFMKNEVVRDFQSIVPRISDRAYQEESLSSLPTTAYEFPNGYNSAFGLVRYQGPEHLFNPHKFDAASKESSSNKKVIPGVHELVRSSLMSCDVDIHNNLWNSIILSGGATLCSGFVERLDAELRMAFAPHTKFKIVASNVNSERVFAPWVGGSILASLGSFQQMWVSRQEYDEIGPNVVHDKCKM